MLTAEGAGDVERSLTLITTSPSLCVFGVLCVFALKPLRLGPLCALKLALTPNPLSHLTAGEGAPLGSGHAIARAERSCPLSHWCGRGTGGEGQQLMLAGDGFASSAGSQ